MFDFPLISFDGEDLSSDYCADKLMFEFEYFVKSYQSEIDSLSEYPSVRVEIVKLFRQWVSEAIYIIRKFVKEPRRTLAIECLKHRFMTFRKKNM